MVTRKTLILSILCLAICSLFNTGSAQDNADRSKKFDQFWDNRTSDEKARLDLFAQALGEQPDFRAAIVGYRSEQFSPGGFSRVLQGYRDYLVGSRGVQPKRLAIVDAGIREPPMIELWLLAPGASAPAAYNMHLKLDAPIQFDSVSFGPECWSEYTLTPEEPKDALKIFAAALHNNPAAKGYLILHPSPRETKGSARKLLAESTDSLRDSGVAPDRVLAALEAPRRCAELHLWLTASDLVIPTRASPKLFLQSKLISEAEKKQFTVRRVEFLGNLHTRDNVLRRRIPALNEGEVFSLNALKQSLAALSRLKIIKPIGLADVELHLDRNYKTVDLLLLFEERRRGRH